MAVDYLARIRKVLDAAEGQESAAKKYLAAGDKEHYEEYMRGAQTQRALAERLMQKHRVEEEELIAKDQFSILPISKTVVLLGTTFSADFRNYYYTLFCQIAQHTGCMTYARYESNPETKRTELIGTLVGYDGDVRYAEILYTGARLAFAANVDPKYDPSLSEEENIYILRRAGIVRKNVAQMVYGDWTHSNSAKVSRIYQEECRKRGEQPAVVGRQVNAATYREAYAREFVWRVDDRLRRARNAVGEHGGAPELFGRMERVEEAFYKLFPQLRPKPAPEPGEQEEDAGKKKESKALKRTEPTKAERQRYHRMYLSPAARAGAAAGIAAGDRVVINRTTTGEKDDEVGEGSAPIAIE